MHPVFVLVALCVTVAPVVDAARHLSWGTRVHPSYFGETGPGDARAAVLAFYEADVDDAAAPAHRFPDLVTADDGNTTSAPPDYGFEHGATCPAGLSGCNNCSHTSPYITDAPFLGVWFLHVMFTWLGLVVLIFGTRNPLTLNPLSRSWAAVATWVGVLFYLLLMFELYPAEERPCDCDPNSFARAVAYVLWTLCFVFFLPWVVIFARRGGSIDPRRTTDYASREGAIFIFLQIVAAVVIPIAADTNSSHTAALVVALLLPALLLLPARAEGNICSDTPVDYGSQRVGADQSGSGADPSVDDSGDDTVELEATQPHEDLDTTGTPPQAAKGQTVSVPAPPPPPRRSAKMACDRIHYILATLRYGPLIVLAIDLVVAVALGISTIYLPC
jgi:hypothetical protein